MSFQSKTITIIAGRRAALQTFGRGKAAGAIGLAAAGFTNPRTAVPSVLTPQVPLSELVERLPKAPRRRDFRTVPMILTNREKWDHEALSEVLAYKPVPRRAWDNTDIAGSCLNLMRNALNVQIWSFKHSDFLAVSSTHGSGQLALYDQAMWEKYELIKLAGDRFKTNTAPASRTKSGSCASLATRTS